MQILKYIKKKEEMQAQRCWPFENKGGGTCVGSYLHKHKITLGGEIHKSSNGFPCDVSAYGAGIRRGSAVHPSKMAFKIHIAKA